MANTTITVDRGKALEVPLELTSEVTLDHHSTTGDRICDAAHLLVRELPGAGIRINSGFFKNLSGRCTTNSENVGERSLNTLLVGNLDSK